MTTPRATKRSVSPFGTAPERENDALSAATDALAAAFGPAEGKRPKNLSSVADAPFIASFLRRTYDAPANASRSRAKRTWSRASPAAADFAATSGPFSARSCWYSSSVTTW